MSKPKLTPPFEHNNESYPKYVQPDAEKLGVSLGEFRVMFDKYCAKFNLKQSDFIIDETLLIRAFIRVDQRKLHYMMYHDGTQISELKEAALLSYWINLYKPISRVKQTLLDTFNATFSIFMILSVIEEHRSRMGLGKLELTSHISADLCYTLVHRNVSYDSMVMLVEVLAL